VRIDVIEVGFGRVFPCCEAIYTEFPWVIKRTLALLARAFSLLFAGNSAGNGENMMFDNLLCSFVPWIIDIMPALPPIAGKIHNRPASAPCSLALR
jgi:hypothetical protein